MPEVGTILQINYILVRENEKNMKIFRIFAGDWYHAGSLKRVTVGAFTPRKLASAINQSFPKREKRG